MLCDANSEVCGHAGARANAMLVPVLVALCRASVRQLPPRQASKEIGATLGIAPIVLLRQR
jgi:hypothetical protein